MFQFKLANTDECYGTLRRQAQDWGRILNVYQDLGELWNQLDAGRHLFPETFKVAYSSETNEITGAALTRTFSVILSPTSHGENLMGLCTITTPNELKGRPDQIGRFTLNKSGFIFDESGEKATHDDIYNNGGWLLLANVFNSVATHN